MIVIFLSIYVLCGIFYLSRFFYNRRERFLQTCEDYSASYSNIVALVTSFFIMLVFWVIIAIIEIFNKEV